MSYNLNSLKGGYVGDYIGDHYRLIKGDTNSLDFLAHADDSANALRGGLGV